MKKKENIVINSIEELKTFMEKGNGSNKKILTLGKLDEQQLVSYLNQVSIDCRRIDFKEWEIQSKQLVKKQSIIIRKTVLFFLLAFFFILLSVSTANYIVPFWKELEEWFKHYPFLANVVSTTLLSAVSGFVLWLFRKKIRNLYHLYMN